MGLVLNVCGCKLAYINHVRENLLITYNVNFNPQKVEQKLILVLTKLF